MDPSVLQRVAVLRADPEIGEVHPNRVFCLPCRKWVALGKGGNGYYLRSWLFHRAQRSHVMTVAGLPYQPFVRLHPTAPPQSRVFMQQEHVKILQADVDIEEVQEYEVFCRPCKKWVSLNKTCRFSLSGWLQHKTSGHHLRQFTAGPLPVQLPVFTSGPSLHSPECGNQSTELCTIHPQSGDSAQNHEEFSLDGTFVGDDDYSTLRSISPVNILSRSPTPSVHGATDDHIHILRTRGYPMTDHGGVRRLPVEQRLEILNADTDTEEVREYCVFCRPCAKWVPLHNISRYGLGAWIKHKRRATHRSQVAASRESESKYPSASRTASTSEKAVQQQHNTSCIIDLTLENDEDDDKLIGTSALAQSPGAENINLEAQRISPQGRRSRGSREPLEAGSLWLSASDDEHSLFEDLPTQSVSCNTATMLKFIKSYLPPTTRFTKEELDIAALVMEEVVREGGPIMVDEGQI